MVTSPQLKSRAITSGARIRAGQPGVAVASTLTAGRAVPSGTKASPWLSLVDHKAH